MSVTKILMAAGGASSSPYYTNFLYATGNWAGGQGLATDSAGNYWIVGSLTNSSYETRVLLTKYSPTGNLLLQTQLGVTTPNGTVNYGYGVGTDSSNNVYITGVADRYNQTYYYCFIAKYNSSGVLQWQNKYTNSSDWSLGKRIRVDASGNSVVVVQNGRTKDCLIAKFSNAGALTWFKRLNIAANSTTTYTNDIARDTSENVIWVGGARPTSANTRIVPIIAKWNSSGTLQWQKQLTWTSGGTHGQYTSVCADPSGNIYAVGNIPDSAGNSQANTCIVKYNSAGALQWKKHINIANIFSSACRVGSDGYLYALVGAYILKFDSSGALQWQRSYSSSDWAAPLSYDINVKDLSYQFVGGYVYDPAGQTLVNVPTDGTHTGSYPGPFSNFVYAITSFTVSDLDWASDATTSFAQAVTNTDFTLTDAVLVSSTPSLTNVQIPM